MTGEEVVDYIQMEYNESHRKVRRNRSNDDLDPDEIVRRDTLGDVLETLRRMMKERRDQREERLRGPK
jgi:hypothetical protein